MSLIGVWFFVGLLYQGQPQPLPNPDLVMSFDFRADGTNTLKYFRKDQEGFCERTASYQYDGQILKQKVVSVHPDNAEECKADLDMQMGRESVSKLSMRTSENRPELLLEVPVAEDTLTLRWQQSPPP